MKFSPILLDESKGKILGHNIAGLDGRRVLTKGKLLTEEDVHRLRQLGRKKVYVAELEPGDIDEDLAALRIAEAIQGANLILSRPSAGRVNLITSARGVLRVDVERVHQLNRSDGITLATLPADRFVRQRQMVATVKIIPYAVPDTRLRRAIADLTSDHQVLGVDLLSSRKIGLILTGSAATSERVRTSFESPLRARVSELGSELELIDHLPLEDEDDEVALAGLLACAVADGYELLILAGETAIMDPGDIAPRAVERAGGDLVCVGLPVDPGNMLMLAYLGSVPILGAPGCARSLKTNALDWVLPRLLVGEELNHEELILMGYGGLLDDTSKRPMPRSRQR